MREKERVFGFTQEDVEKLIASYAKDAKEPTMSMGNDKPLAVMSEKPQLLFNYFRQQFAH